MRDNMVHKLNVQISEDTACNLELEDGCLDAAKSSKDFVAECSTRKANKVKFKWTSGTSKGKVGLIPKKVEDIKKRRK